jgi:phytoene synthase
MSLPAVEVQFAYRECEALTRRAAANFYYGIRLLPKPKREAMSAVYAFARRIDDIGDGAGGAEAKLTALQGQRARLAAIAPPTAGCRLDGRGGDPVFVGLADAAARFSLPVDALELLITGVEQDVAGTHYETFDELVRYCRAVAGSIGRLCLAIFSDGQAGARPSALADDLGVAMQLTNILRDVCEDHARGRVYLPAEDLRRFSSAPPPDLSVGLIAFEAARAGEWFEHGLGLLEFLDRRSASCVLAMTGIYRRILARITADPEAILRGRISLPASEKAMVAASSLIGAQRRSRAGLAPATPGPVRVRT